MANDANKIFFEGAPKYSMHRFHNFVKAQYVRNLLHRDLWIFLILLVPTMVFLDMTNFTRQSYFVGALTWGSIATDELAPINLQEGPTEGPNFGDTDTNDKWALWFESVLAPKLFDSDNPTVGYPLGWPAMAGNNILVGGVRVRQQRAWRKECPTPVDDVQCYETGRGSGYDNDDTDNGPLLYYECDSWMERAYGGLATVSKTFSCDGNSIVIPADSSYDNTIDILNNVLLPNGVANFASTRFLVVEYVTYNLPTDIFVYNTHWLQVSVAGKLIPNGLPKPFVLERRGGVLAFSVVMFAIVLLLFAHHMFEFATYARVNGLYLAFVDQIFSFWHLENIATLIAYIVQLCLVFHMWAITADLPKPLISESIVANFPQNLVTYAGMYERLNLLRAVTMLLVFLRILKFGVLFPPVFVITTAILKASKTIFGVGVLCIAAIVAFAVSGYIVFGSRIVGFHNIAAAIDSMSRMLVGDYDMDQLESQGIVLATLFFWAFLIVCFFILLNFITAILSNAVEGAEELKGESVSEILNFQWKLSNMWWSHVGTDKVQPAAASKSSASKDDIDSMSTTLYGESFEDAFGKDPKNFNFNFFTFLKECFVYYVWCEPSRTVLDIIISLVHHQPPASYTQDIRTLERKFAVDDRLSIFRDKQVTYDELCEAMLKGVDGRSLTVRQFNMIWFAFLSLSPENVEEQSLTKRISEDVHNAWNSRSKSADDSRQNSISKRGHPAQIHKDAHTKLQSGLQEIVKAIEELNKLR